MAKKKSSPEAKAAAAAAVASSPTAIATSPVMELKTSPAAVDNRTSLNAAAAASRTGGNNGGSGDDSAAASNAATAAAASIREVVWSHPLFFFSVRVAAVLLSVLDGLSIIQRRDRRGIVTDKVRSFVHWRIGFSFFPWKDFPLLRTLSELCA